MERFQQLCAKILESLVAAQQDNAFNNIVL
jgi:hypothetical protein